MEAVALLSDGQRNVTSTFTVLYAEKPVEEIENTAPYFAVSVNDQYTRMKAENSTDEIAPVILGKVYDA